MVVLFIELFDINYYNFFLGSRAILYFHRRTFKLTFFDFSLFLSLKTTCWESRRSEISSVIRDKKINEFLLTVLTIFVIEQ